VKVKTRKKGGTDFSPLEGEREQLYNKRKELWKGTTEKKEY